MEIREGWVVVICIVVGFGCFLIGRVAGWESVKWDCINLGAFSYMTATYKCEQTKKRSE